MKSQENYDRGLLYITYLLISSDEEISENELYFLHKMRVEEGISDEIFADHFKSLLEKTEQKIYQIGIDSINLCTDVQKLKIFSRLYQMALVDKILKVKEVRFILYAIKITRVNINKVIQMVHQKKMAA